MAQKKIQKMFYYSSESTKQYIENRIEDLAIRTNYSSSFIIENILMDRLLPTNEEAKSIIRDNLYTEQCGVRKTLDAIFSANAAGKGWNSKYTNFKSLVEYCINYCDATSSLNGEKGDLSYFTSKLDSIIDRIGNCVGACIEIYDRHMYKSQFELAKIMLENIKNNPTEIIFRNYYQLIYDCWDMLDDWSITYRYLACLTRMSNFQENTSARNALYDIISSVSQEW